MARRRRPRSGKALARSLSRNGGRAWRRDSAVTVGARMVGGMTEIAADTDLSWMGTTLLVWAHPDDETYLTGGTAAALVDAGHRVVAVTATRGEAGGPDTTPAAGSRCHGRAAHAGARRGHAHARRDRAPLARLRRTAAARGRPGARGTTRLVELLDEVRPDTVVTFGPDGLHRAPGPPGGEPSGSTSRSLVRPSHHGCCTRSRPRPDRVDPELDEDFGGLRARPAAHLRARASSRCGSSSTGRALSRKVAALRAQASQTHVLVEAVGLERYRAWVATEALAEPARAPATAH